MTISHEDWIAKQHHSIWRIADPAWVYADIGACRGELLSSFIRCMHKGHAFEPDPTNHQLLASTLPNLHLSAGALTLNNLAVSNFIGSASFYFNGTHEGNLSGKDVRGEEHTDSCEVNCTTLDEYFKEREVHYIKIDTEGTEWDVFEGAKNLLERDILWQVEFHNDEDWHNIEKIYNYGYDLYNLDYNKLSKDSGRPYQAYLSKINLKKLIK